MALVIQSWRNTVGTFNEDKYIKVTNKSNDTSRGIQLLSLKRAALKLDLCRTQRQSISTQTSDKFVCKFYKLIFLFYASFIN